MDNIFSAIRKYYWAILSLVAGACTTLAFSPFDITALVFITLALVFYLWNQLSPKQAAVSGWLFGIGLQCSGVSWIYYSLHVHGSAPAFFAATLIFLLCSYLSLYTGLAAYVINRFLPAQPALRLMVFYPASWLIFEWLQGYVMTGFAWMQLGYTQIDTPLSGFAPLLGNHAVGGLVAVSAGIITWLLVQGRGLRAWTAAVSSMVLVVIWVTGGLLKNIDWTQADGEPIKVSVIQGNIAQKDKWKPYMKLPTMKRYREMSLAQESVDLIVWPETAVPNYRHRVVPYIDQLRRDMRASDTDLLLGIFVKNDQGGVLNSVMSINGRGVDSQGVAGHELTDHELKDQVLQDQALPDQSNNDDISVYHKRHLVPLGEYIPLRFLIEFFNRFVKIPMSDIASGADDQPLINVAGVPAGITICFEEAFSRDLIRDLPQAKILVNVSNDAWFEDSHEPHQHHTIARMRALETGRYMIRSTNTGITSIIGPHGEVIDRLPQFKVATLNAEVQPLTGATPYVRWGDWLILGLCCVLLICAVIVRRRS